MKWGEPWLRWWGHPFEQHVKGEGVGAKFTRWSGGAHVSTEGTWEGWGKVYSSWWGSMSCRKGGLVVLTFYLLISNPFPSSFSAHHPPLSSYLHPITPPGGPGTGRICSRLVVVEG